MGQSGRRLGKADFWLAIMPTRIFCLAPDAERRIVLGAAACIKPGEIGALMRREGVYSSSLATWLRQYAADELTGTASKKRGPKIDPARAELKQLAAVTRERDKLKIQLSNAQLVIEVQKKLPRCWSNSNRSRHRPKHLFNARPRRTRTAPPGCRHNGQRSGPANCRIPRGPGAWRHLGCQIGL